MGGSTFRATHIKSTAVLHRQPLKERHQGPFGTSSNLFGASFSFPRERKQENSWLKCSLLEPPPLPRCRLIGAGGEQPQLLEAELPKQKEGKQGTNSISVFQDKVLLNQ